MAECLAGQAVHPVPDQSRGLVARSGRRGVTATLPPAPAQAVGRGGNAARFVEGRAGIPALLNVMAGQMTCPG